MDKKNAFTIVELLVAMTLLVMLLGLSAMVFNTAVKTQRAAAATIDITRSLSAITQLINTDFDGFRKDAPMFLHFQSEIDTMATGDIGPRRDMIHFFADGVFQTTKQYSASGQQEIVHGDVARIYYGHANTSAVAMDFEDVDVLARRCHVLTALIFDPPSDPDNYPATIPNLFGVPPDYYASFSNNINTTFTTINENRCEYNTISLTDWLNTLNFNSENVNYFILTVLTDAARPTIDVSGTPPDGYWNLFAQGVAQIKIQWAYTSADLIDPGTGLPPAGGFTEVRWWPSLDPDDDGDYSDSDFGSDGMNITEFGVYFNLTSGTTLTDWFSTQNCRTNNMRFANGFFPKALMFTFTLRDSNGFFKDGKTFTHIVYLDN